MGAGAGTSTWTLQLHEVDMKIKSNVRVTIRDLDGNITRQIEKHNLITSVGKNMIRDLLRGTIGDGEIKYVALGTDSTPPVVADTTLGTEIFRKVIFNSFIGGPGELITIWVIAPAEAIGAIEEVGFFAGAGAGAGVDTGIMIARVLWSHNKTALESVQIDRYDTISEI